MIVNLMGSSVDNFDAEKFLMPKSLLKVGCEQVTIQRMIQK